MLKYGYSNLIKNIKYLYIILHTLIYECWLLPTVFIILHISTNAEHSNNLIWNNYICLANEKMQLNGINKEK